MGHTQVIVCGSVAIDRIMSFSGRYRDLIKPDKLDVLSVSPLLNKLQDTPGGIGANISFNLASLGEQAVLLGSVGRDAKEYIGSLSDHGVDTSHVHFSEFPTASFNVITDSDGNQVGGFYPGAMFDSEDLSFKPWKDQDVLAMVSAHDPEAMNTQVEECRTHDIRLVYDPGQQVSSPLTDLSAGIAAAEVLFVNEYELNLLSEAIHMSATDIKSQVPVVITTFGSKGSFIEGRQVEKPLQIPIAHPTNTVDPTGAGDGYRAGFLYGYLRKWDLITCGQLGAVVASFIVEHLGTQTALEATLIMRRYQETFNQEIKL